MPAEQGRTSWVALTGLVDWQHEQKHLEPVLMSEQPASGEEASSVGLLPSCFAIQQESIFSDTKTRSSSVCIPVAQALRVTDAHTACFLATRLCHTITLTWSIMHFSKAWVSKESKSSLADARGTGRYTGTGLALLSFTLFFSTRTTRRY